MLSIRQLRTGGKILQLDMDRIRFIDSLSFFQMPLSFFPKTFGLTELAKAHFPHKFNRPENQSYVGPLSSQSDYLPDSMTLKGKREFLMWYEERLRDQPGFDFQEELELYCRSDVELLKAGCLQFKTGFSPFQHPTIALCNRDLRMNRMTPNTIASEPMHGWRQSTKHSTAAMEWLLWIEYELRQSDWNSLSPEDQDSNNLMALAYPNSSVFDHPLEKQVTTCP